MKKILSIIIAMVMILSVPFTSLAYSDNSELYRDFVSISVAKTYKYKYNSIVVVNMNSLDSDGLAASGLLGAVDGKFDYFSITNNIDASIDGIEYEAKEAKAKNIYFIGGDKVIPRKVKNDIKRRGFNVICLEGKNRIETSYKIAKEIKRVKGSVKEIALTKGYGGEADSVSIAYEARKRSMPVILTNGKNIPFNTDRLEKVYAIGGNKVISDSLVNNTNAIRLGGTDRYLTNKKVLKYFGRINSGKITAVRGDSKNDHIKFAIAVSSFKGVAPVALISENSDKTVFEGAKFVQYYGTFHDGPSLYMRTQCYNATFGKNITDISDYIYKVTGEGRREVVYAYNDTDNNYVLSSDDYEYYKDNYYIYDMVSIDGDLSDFNIMVRKSDKKVFCWGPYSYSPVPYHNYM